MTSRKLLTLPDRQAEMRERHADSPAMVADAEFAQRHFTVKQIADLWGLGCDAVRRIFRDEPGVLAFGSSAGRRRSYTTMRIPQHVVERVYRRSVRR